jgi:hypothetical protein
MALIIDPDQLNQATEVVFDTTARTISLLVAGNLSTDGVTLKALYSFCKEEWKNDAALIKFPFPFTPITDESFEIKDGWDFLNNSSRYLIRTAGWTVVNTSGVVTQRWAGIVGLGSIQSGEQLYYDQGQGATNAVLTGQINQAVQIYSDPNGDASVADGFDRRTAFTLFVRERGRQFGQVSIADIGVTSMESQAYRFPISTSADLKITEIDANILANAPYFGMSITYYAVAQTRSIGGTNRSFGIIIDGNDGTAEQIYEFVQYNLRQNADIDDGAGTVNGKTAAGLLRFTGDTLSTLNATNASGGGTGVFIDNFLTADTNRLTFSDNSSIARTFPFVAVVTLQFNNNLVSDTDSIYRVFFTNANGNLFGTSNTVIVKNAAGTDVLGTVGGGSSVQFDFDYDGNVQGGRTGGTDAAITVVAIGLSTGQYVAATGTIARSTANVVSLVAPLERNYINPV